MRSLKETGRGAGADSEQPFEANHIDMDNVWGRYAVRDCTSKAYRTALLRAVCNINASHTPIRQHNDQNEFAQADQRHFWEGPSTVMHSSFGFVAVYVYVHRTVNFDVKTSENR